MDWGITGNRGSRELKLSPEPARSVLPTPAFATGSAPTLDPTAGRSGTEREALSFGESSRLIGEHRGKDATTSGNRPQPPAGKALS